MPVPSVSASSTIVNPYVIHLAHVGVVIHQVLQQLLVPFVGRIVRYGVTHPVHTLVQVDHLSLLLYETYYALLVSKHEQHH